MLRNYEEIVELYRKKRVREMLPNGSRSHAATLFHNIFEAAISDKLELRIVTGSLVKDFYNPLTEKLRVLLTSNSVSVILTDPQARELSENSFLAALVQSPNGRVMKANHVGQYNHLVVAGDSIYRIELDHNRGTAAANFNDPSLGKTLVAMFEDLKSVSIPFDHMTKPYIVSPMIAEQN